MRLYPHERFSRAMCTTRFSNSWSMRGRPLDLRGCVPSQGWVHICDARREWCPAWHRRHLFQGLLAQLLAQLGERFAVAVCELDAPSDLLAEHAMFCDQYTLRSRSSASTDSVIDPSNFCQSIPLSPLPRRLP